ncbi:dienelactone hydrolase family protein [Plantactinospora siamensis]|uniref:Dienelactone hydrolase family protein n=1 Tax=Plantactinospora siamensis TaxID=555372 RepID=A0ABV6NT52_9ACTN
MQSAARGRVVPATLAVLAVLAASLGAVGLARADDGLTHRSVTVSGVPLTEVRATTAQATAGATSPVSVAPTAGTTPTAGATPTAGTPTTAGTAGRRPGVVVAHGFAGSRRLMTPLADTLARHGYVVVLLDFAGHGANPARLPGAGQDTGAGTAALAADLDTAVGYLRSRPDVDPARIGLVGHSMGAGAVARYAVAHPEIVATVAISLPGADPVPAGGDRPRALLLLVGGNEFAGFRAAATEAVRRAGPAGDRRAVVVPGVEHISILFAGRTHAEMTSWLDARLAPPPGPRAPARPTGYLAPAGLLLLGFALGLQPLARVLLGAGGRRASARTRLPLALLATVLATGLGAVLPRLLPFDRLPLAVGNYLIGLLAVTGALLLGIARLPRLGRVDPAATGSDQRPASGAGRPGTLRLAIAAVLLAGYAVAAVAVPISLGFTSAAPTGARWWLLPIVTAAAWLFLLGAERITGGGPGRLVPYVVAVAGVTVAALVGVAPGFVLLVVPLFAILLAWQFGWATALGRLAAPAWLIALPGAVLLGWPIATTLPLTG